MDKSLDSALPLAAAALVLFSSLIRPETTLIISLTSLLGLAWYYYRRNQKKKR